MSYQQPEVYAQGNQEVLATGDQLTIAIDDDQFFIRNNDNPVLVRENDNPVFVRTR
jgi:hypothetical protein